jgi:hypothetical protein
MTGVRAMVLNSLNWETKLSELDSRDGEEKIIKH